MLAHVSSSLQEAATQPLGLVLALVLGGVSAVASACCTLPALGLLVGYSGAQASGDRRAAFVSVLFFAAGMIVALMIVGAVAGLVGQTAQASLGRYWTVFAGGVAIFLGLATLDLLPFNVSTDRLKAMGGKTAGLYPALAGLVLGGIVAACSLPCNPGIYVVIGAAVLQGAVLWAMLLLAMFAIGFSLPLAAIMLGVSVGKLSLTARRADVAMRWVAGLVLLAVGFYFVWRG